MMHGYGYGFGMDSGWWVLMSVFWVALIVVVVWALVRLFSSRDASPGDGDAKRVLDRRLASGEIDVATYDQLRDRLQQGALSAGR